MKNRIIIGAVLFGVVAIAVASCAAVYVIFFGPVPAQVEQGPKNPIPDAPIVFKVEDGSYPPQTLGFMDADGGSLTTLKLDNSYTRNKYQILDQTMWGPDGSFLVTQLVGGWMEAGQATPVILTNSETRICTRLVQDEYPWPVDSTHLLLTRPSGREVTQIVRFNMKTCQDESVVYTIPNVVYQFAISSDGWLAYETVLGDYDGTGFSISALPIIVRDDHGKEVFRTGDTAHSPNWSKDGEWLAYDIPYSVPRLGIQEGIMIVRRDGSELQRLTDLGSDPWWSPDGQWLVYWTYKGDIYKINVSTKEKVLLYHGGSYPTWR